MSVIILGIEYISDNDDMSRQYKGIYAQGSAYKFIPKFYMFIEYVKYTLFKSYCTSLDTIEHSQLENYV